MAWKKVGTIMKGRNNSDYLKVDFGPKSTETEIVLKKGQILSIFNPRKSKFATEEKNAKIPDYVKADVFIGPDKE